MMTQTAIFAGGCFWCMVKPFDQIAGVKKVLSGYTGGHIVNPTYQQVCAGGSGHVEAVKIWFDPQIISYKKLLDIYWQQIDPTDNQGQFQDRGPSYRPVIFVANAEQKKIAEDSKKRLQKTGRFEAPIITQIAPAKAFYSAEDEHQDFYKKNPLRESLQEAGGRVQFKEKYWG